MDNFFGVFQLRIGNQYLKLIFEIEYSLLIIHPKFVSRNMCYYSGNHKFGTIKSRLVTPPFVMKLNKIVLKQHLLALEQHRNSVTGDPRIA